MSLKFDQIFRFVNGSTLLHTACAFGHFDLVVKLLNTIDIEGHFLNANIRDCNGVSPLHNSYETEVIRILIEYGADVNCVDLEGNTPLHFKCAEGKLEAIKMLHEFGADLTIQNFKVYLIVY